MPDPLLDAIKQAIDQPLDGRTFENCAVELLRERYYPKLRGTPEKQDMGVDGICGPDSDPEFILVATTRKDFTRNLRESINDIRGSRRDVPNRRLRYEQGRHHRSATQAPGDARQARRNSPLSARPRRVRAPSV